MSLPKPYYEDDSCRIFHGDCREILSEIERESVDLVLTDPPYFRVKDEVWDRRWKNANGFLEWLGDVVAQLSVVLKPNGSLYLFAGHDLAARTEVLVSEHMRVLNRIRWVKENGWHKKAAKENLRSFLSPWEEIIFAEQYADHYGEAERALHKEVYAPIGRYIQLERERAGLSRSEVEVALGFVSRSEPTRGTAICYRWEEGSSLPTRETYERLRAVLNHRDGEYLRRDYEYLRRDYEELRRDYEELRRDYEELRRPFAASDEATDIWRFPTVAPYPAKHPCEKPVSMYEYMLRVSSRPDSLVLDPFAGVGTAAIAAKNVGRRSVLIEQEERYCEIAVRRLAQEVLPLEAL